MAGSTPKKEPPKKSYHHGNLHAALVAVATESVRSGGADDLSLREMARMVEVSPGAVYKHFVDKRSLLAAVAQEGFSILGSRVAAARIEQPVLHGLPAIGLAYVSFAADEPLLFALMFGPNGPNARRASLPSSPPGGAFESLRIAIAANKRIPPENVEQADLALAWAAAHGAARLVADGLWKRNDLRIDMAIHGAIRAILDQPKTQRRR
jgi:AcrR family transcriptional regulator